MEYFGCGTKKKTLIKLLKEIMTGLEKKWVDKKEKIVENKPVAVKIIPVPAKKGLRSNIRKRSTSNVRV